MAEKKISHAGFARLREAMLRAECEGYGPDDVVRVGLTAVGLAHEPTEFVVDPTLDGPIYPFMEWPAELLPHE